jgi:hypothetical protein
LVTHPVVWSKAVLPSLKAVRAEQSMKIGAAFVERINHKNGLDKIAKLEINEPDGTGNFTRVEDNFRLDLTRKIPLVGVSVDASNRMYATALNELRGGLFDLFIAQSNRGRRISKNPKNLSKEDTQFIQDLGKLVNTMTGRAPVKGAEVWSRWIWAPRFLKSTFDIVRMEPVLAFKKTPEARMLALKQYGRGIGMIAALYGIASLFDHDIEKDPRSSSFGNVSLGKSHTVNFLGPLKPMIVFLSRIISGQQKVGDKVTNLRETMLPFATEKELLDKTPFGKDMMHILSRFLQTKVHPAGGVLLTGVTGKTFGNKNPTISGVLADTFIPLTLRQTPEMFEQENAVMGTLLTLANFFGAPVASDFNKMKEVNQRLQEKKQSGTVGKWQ